MLSIRNKARFMSVMTILAMLFSFANVTPAAAQDPTPPAAGDNVALGKPATQSSDYLHGCNPTAAKAIDGNTNGIFFPNCSITSTNADPQAWWQVDLQAIYFIDTIVLWNRTDCCSDRLNDFDVLISQNGTSWSTFYYPGTAPTTTTFNINASARYVKVQLRGINILSLAEVQVFSGTAVTVKFDARALALSNGANVSSWGGQTSHGTPTYFTNQTPNGGPAVQFNGGGDRMGDDVSLPSSTAGDWILVAVIKPNNIGSYHNLADDNPETKPMLWVDPGFNYELNFGGGTGAKRAGTGTDGWDIVIADSRLNQLYVNSTTPNATGGGATSYTASKLYDFFSRNGGQTYQGLVAEMRIYNNRADFGDDFTGLYNEMYAKWMVNTDAIAPIASPTQSPAANGAGWNNSDVTVTWNWMDNAGGLGINPALCVSSNISSGEGNPITLTATCEDLAGNTGSAAYTVIVDKTRPTITGSRSPIPNPKGWNNSDVTVSFACSDELSGVAIGSPSAAAVLSGEGTRLSARGFCYDIASNLASNAQREIKIDRTAPNTGITAPYGWNNTDVTLTLTPSDGLSGVSITNYVLDGGAPQTGTSIVISTEGLHTVEYWSVDNAGNTEAQHTANVKIDKTPPTISHSQLPLANGNGWNNSDVTVTFVCGDTLSGLASCTAPQTVTTEGQLQAVTGTALDNAGNSATDPATVSIDKGAPTISVSADRAPNADGWYNDDVLVSFTCADTFSSLENIANSGIASCPPAQTLGEGANQSASGTATDAAGNASASATVSGINVDKTAPSISAAATTAPNGAGWYNGDVTIHFTCVDAGSGIPLGACPVDQTLSAEGAAVASTAQTVTDAAGNTSAPSNVVTVQIDKTAPTISAAVTTTPNAAGWYNSNVTVQFTCTDAGSGIAAGACPANQTLSAEGVAVASSAQTVADAAGNTSDPSNIVSVQIDKTVPMVSLVDGPANSGSYYFGSVPAAPTCSASDALSGLDGSCMVSGYSALVGSQTVTAAAKDLASNQNSASSVYTVLAWTTNGFFQPVDMGGVWNTVKNGSTVPLKFEVFAGSTELTSTSIVNQPLTATQTLCTGGTTDDIELLASGATSLRYDATAGQFIYNWQTPKKVGYCYVITVKLADGTSISANFKLK